MSQIKLINNKVSDSLDNTKSKVLSQYPFVIIVGRTGTGKTTKALDLIDEYVSTNGARWVVIFSPTVRFDKTLHSKISEMFNIYSVSFNHPFNNKLEKISFHDNLEDLNNFVRLFINCIDNLEDRKKMIQEKIKLFKQEGIDTTVLKEELKWVDSLIKDHSIVFLIDDSTGNKLFAKTHSNPLFNLILARRHINASIFMPIHNYKSLVKPLRTQVNHYCLSKMSEDNVKLIWNDLPVTKYKNIEEFKKDLYSIDDKYDWLLI